MEEGRGWGGDFSELRARLDEVFDASHQVAVWMRAKLSPADLPPGVAMLTEGISKAQSLAGHLSERLHFGPLDLLTHGHLMSREAYYLLVAMGVLGGGAYTSDPYADFQMTHYEDDQRRCYICLDERPPAGTIRLHLGMWPEEIAWDQLRPEQRDFFERHLPEVAGRFRR